jgi:hypothetical protein
MWYEPAAAGGRGEVLLVGEHLRIGTLARMIVERPRVSMPPMRPRRSSVAHQVARRKSDGA